MVNVDAAASFVQLHASAACCRWEQTYHKLTVNAHGSQLHKTFNSSQRSCERACAKTALCEYFSYSGHFWQHRLRGGSIRHASECRICAACDLQAGAREAAAASVAGPLKYRVFSSFRRRHGSDGDGGARRGSSPMGREALERLAPVLQGEGYSGQLYGGTGRVELSSLRVLWLQLLDAPSRRLVASIGVCKYSAQPPLRPFFAPIGIGNNSIQPHGAVWIAQRAPVAIPEGGWVEVAHCPWIPRSWSDRSWLRMPMWLYAAAGSGVSINVGRTRVLPSYEALGRLLNRCQFWRSPSAGPECDARRVPHDDLDTRTPTHDCPDLENVDSVQVLAHYEYFSREPRHEIVMLRLDNCGRLRPHTPGVMCGREPHLQPCRDDSEALRRLADCSKCDLCGKKNPLGVQVTHEGCGSSACWLDENGRYQCPQ